MMRQHRPTRKFIAAVAGIALIAAACGDDSDDDEDPPDTTDPEEEVTPPPDDEEEDPRLAALREVGDADPTCTADSDGTFSIGGVLVETGQLAALGPPQLVGVEMAIDEINDAGGVLDNDVEWAQRDSGEGDPDLATPAVEEHIQSGVDVIYGASASGVTQAIIDTVTGACVLQFSPSATSPEFTTWDDDDMFFRTAPSDVLQARVLADLAIEDGNATAAILVRQDDYGEGLLDFIGQQYTEQGGEVVLERAFDPLAPDFSAEIDQVVDAAPDALFLVSFPDEAPAMLSGLFEAGITPDTTSIYMVEGNMDDDSGDGVPEGSMVGIRGTIPGSEIIPEYRDRAGDHDASVTSFTFGPESYDGIIILALAAVSAGTDQADEVARHINSVTRDGETCTSFAECRDLLEDGEDIAYEGPSGPGVFALSGERTAAVYGVYNWNDDNTVDFDDVDYRSVAIN